VFEEPVSGGEKEKQNPILPLYLLQKGKRTKNLFCKGKASLAMMPGGDDFSF